MVKIVKSMENLPMSAGYELIARLFTPSELKPIPDLEEEYDLIDAFKAGDVSAGKRVMGAWALICYKRSLRRIPTSFQFTHQEDIVVSMCVAMYKALNKWDREKTNRVRFGSFAQYYIGNEVRMLIAKMRYAIVIPDSSLAENILNDVRKLSQLGLGIEEIIEKITESRKYSQSRGTIRIFVELALASNLELDAPIGYGDDTRSNSENFALPNIPSPEDELAEREDLMLKRRILAEGMRRLTPREQHILQERWLREDADETATFQDLSEVYNLSRERIRQIQEQAIRKLQSFAAGYQLLTPVLR